jgi:hypothetical protein
MKLACGIIFNHTMTHIHTTDHVGRLEMNQAFTLDIPDPIYNEKLSITPDPDPNPVPYFTWKESFDLRGFSDGDSWKKAIYEGAGTCLLVWLTGLATFSLVPTVS